mgnify:CR=1 FL=1
MKMHQQLIKLTGFLCLLLSTSLGWSHVVQFQYCVGCDGKFVLWIEHWHGYEDPSTTTMTLTISYGGYSETITSSPGGEAHGLTADELPGCSTDITYLAGCPGSQNTYLDWVYYEFDGIPEGTTVNFGILSGSTPFTEDGCGLYPQYFTFDIPYSTGLELPDDYYFCHNELTDPIPLPEGEYSWLNDNTDIGLGPAGDNVIPSFVANGIDGDIATINVSRGACQVDSFDIIINPAPHINVTFDDSLCLEDIASFTNDSYVVTGGIGYSWSFGDGGTSLEPEPSHLYTGVGDYEVALAAVSDSGCISTWVDTVSVFSLPDAEIIGFDPICEGVDSVLIQLVGHHGQAPYQFTYTLNGVAMPDLVCATDTANIYLSGMSDTTYTIHLTNVVELGRNSCSSVVDETFTAIINPRPTATIEGTTSVCVNAEAPVVSFAAGGATAPYTFYYTINDGATIELVSAMDGTASVLAPTAVDGIFEYDLLSVVESSGTACSQIIDDSITVEVTPLPIASIAGTIEVCQFDEMPEVTFVGGDATAPYSFTYTLNGGADLSITSTGDTALISQPTDIPGTYTYELFGVIESSGNTCYQDQLGVAEIIVHELPDVYAGEDFYVCDGYEATLNGSGAGGAGVYIWDNGVTDGVPFLQTETFIDYVVTGIDSNTCQNTDTIQVEVKLNPLVHFEADRLSICDEECVNFTSLAEAYGDAVIVDWEWRFENGTTSNSPDVSVCYDIETGSQEYFYAHLAVTDNYGCIDSLMAADYIEVTPNPIAIFDYTPSDIDPLDPTVDFVNLSVYGSYYFWDFDWFHDEYGNMTSDQFEPRITYPYGPSDHNVMLVAYSVNGLCVDTAYSSLFVPDELLFFVPNVFTPDGDDFNESFQPVFVSGFDPYDFELLIFNRWGEILFETHDAKKGWNGTYGNRELVSDGVYIWSVRFKSSYTDEIKEFNGHVTVLK